MVAPTLTPLYTLPEIARPDSKDCLVVHDESEGETKKVPLFHLVSMIGLDAAPDTWAGSFMSFRWFDAAGVQFTPATRTYSSTVTPSGVLVLPSAEQVHAGAYCSIRLALREGTYAVYGEIVQGPDFGIILTPAELGAPLQRTNETNLIQPTFGVIPRGTEGFKGNWGNVSVHRSGIYDFQFFCERKRDDSLGYRWGGGLIAFKYQTDVLTSPTW